MVTDITFVQGANGVKHLAGTSGSSGSGGPFMGRHMLSGESGKIVGANGLIVPSAMAVERGLTKLHVIGDRLQLSREIQEAGGRMFKLAAQLNFTAGRPTHLVASACLYTVCRRNRSPYLMIDFSDILRIPVVNIGRTYLRLKRRLTGGDLVSAGSHAAGEVPIIDPSLFVERFARHLDLGGQQRTVQHTAVKLIQFMHRDWICLGRRPNGLCGAALLIACCYHGLSQDAATLSKIVRIGEETIRKRLMELQRTPLALMNREEFLNADPIASPLTNALPPCMRETEARHRRLKALQDLQREEQAAIEDRVAKKLCLPLVAGTSAATSSGAKRPLAAESALMPPPPAHKKARGPLGAPKALLPLPGPAGDASDGSSLGGEANAKMNRFTERVPSEATITQVAKDISSELGIEAILGLGTSTSSSSSSSSAPAPAATEATATVTATSASATQTGSKGPEFEAAMGRIDDLLAGRKDFANLPLVASQNKDSSTATAPVSPSPVADSTTPRSAIASGKKTSLGSEAADSDEEETLSDVDDDELEQYLLDEEERKDKADVWYEINRDYLEEWHVRSREQQKRKERAAASEAASETASSAGSTRSARSRRWRPSAGSASESTMLALQKKTRVSPTLINMDAINSLFE